MLYIEDVEQAIALLKPIRIEIVKQMHKPRTCPELATMFGETAQKIYYHVKALEEVGLIEKVSEQRVRGIMEGHYQAKAQSYWLSPRLVGQIGGETPAANQSSLRFVLSLAEEIHEDMGHLGQQVGKEIPSLGLSAYIYLPDNSRRAEFLQEITAFFQGLAEKYGLPDLANPTPTNEQGYRLILTCYPKEVPNHD